MTIRYATTDDAADVARLVHGLLVELGASVRPDDARTSRDLAQCLIQSKRHVVLVAEDENGVATAILNASESAAMHAGGRFGWIDELYVEPRVRGSGIGAQLLRAIVAHARDRDWNRIDVGAPDEAQHPRTSAFYRRNGFEDVGPRLKLTIS